MTVLEDPLLVDDLLVDHRYRYERVVGYTGSRQGKIPLVLGVLVSDHEEIETWATFYPDQSQKSSGDPADVAWFEGSRHRYTVMYRSSCPGGAPAPHIHYRIKVTQAVGS